ncbi:MAG: glycosyltransferase family 2 protein [Anaerolineales bacterium]
MDYPLVSVIIATYNRKNYVMEAIDSALAQSIDSFEVIVVNDGSTDGTGSALAEYDGRLRYAFQPNQGESVARNHGLSLARGKYIAFLDDDDRWHPAKLARHVEVLETYPKVGLVACQGHIIDEHGELISNRLAFPRNDTGLVSLEEVIVNSPIGATNSTARRDLLEEVGGFDPQLRFGEDWDLALRVAARSTIFFESDPLVYMRARGDRQSKILLPIATAERRFQDRVRTLDKLRERKLDEVDWAIDIALARAYAVAGLDVLAYGKEELASQRLRRAAHLDPDCWLSKSCPGHMALAYAHSLAREHAPQQGHHLISRIFRECLPLSRRASVQFARYWLGHFYLDIALTRAKAEDLRGAQRAAFYAMRYRPGLVKNRGLVSVLLASLVGYGSIASLKQSARATARRLSRQRVAS